MATREKGVKKMPCPTCETDLKLVEQPDGSVATESCSNCFPEPEKEKASKKSEPREKGTTVSTTTSNEEK